MLGQGDWADSHRYEVQTLKDDLRLFTPELPGWINAVVVRAGHTLLKKSPDDGLRGRRDSLCGGDGCPFPDHYQPAV